MAAVQIMIIDNIAVSGHTEYRIEVSFLGRTWVIQRRFSMFDKLHRKLHGDLPQMARDCLINLYRQSLKNRISSVRAALKQPGLDADLVQRRTEQLLDLIQRLNDIPAAEI